MQAPRPLPPNPVAKSQSSLSPVVSHKPSALGKGGVSLARERRRRNKQEGGGSRGRVVLKSRSAADLCKKEEKREEVDFGTPPAIRSKTDEPSSKTKNETNSDKKEREQDRTELRNVPDNDRGNDEPDSGPPPLEEEVKEKNNEIHVRVDVATPSSKDSHHHQQQPVVVGKKVSRTRRVKSDSDNVELAGNDAVPALNGQSSDEVEVEEFFTLLDTTLHLPDSPLWPTPFDSEDHPGPPVSAFSVVDQPSQEHHQRTLPPGRLADRIKTLRE